MNTVTKEIQEKLSPADALQKLLEGNKRFLADVQAPKSLQEQVVETSTGQFPFAVILSCIDSRVSAELVFDLGIGDIFNVRVAGNIVNEDVLGSIEYACKVAGSKIVVVMGHTKCGAITAACHDVELGNITPLLDKIKPAVKATITDDAEVSDAMVDQVAEQNVQLSIDRIRKESSILSEMEANGEIQIVGSMYSVATGEVKF